LLSISFDGLNMSSAARAYKQALSTLVMLTAHPPAFTFDPSLMTNANSKSMLSAFLPNLQGQGPVGSTLRMLMKLHYYTIRRLSNSLGSGQDSIGIGSRRKDDEQRTKAIKVLDLLHHSVELGSTDALYTLAKISLVSAFVFFLMMIVHWTSLSLSSPLHSISHRIPN